MFGYASFAEVPFATLPSAGGTSFFESLTEAFSIADNNTQLFAFSETRTEPITVNDLNSDANIFIGTINELVGIAAANTEVFDALQSITEPISAIENQQTISAGFAQSVAENVNVNDVLVPFFAALQSRNEDALLDNIQTISAQFSTSKTEPININDVRNITAQFNVVRNENVIIDNLRVK